jgi:hypothetical protein
VSVRYRWSNRSRLGSLAKKPGIGPLVRRNLLSHDCDFGCPQGDRDVNQSDVDQRILVGFVLASPLGEEKSGKSNQSDGGRFFVIIAKSRQID